MVYKIAAFCFRPGCVDIDGLVQESGNSSALAMELRLSCTNPSMLLSSIHQAHPDSNPTVNSDTHCNWHSAHMKTLCVCVIENKLKRSISIWSKHFWMRQWRIHYLLIMIEQLISTKRWHLMIFKQLMCTKVGNFIADIFRCILLKKIASILIRIPLKFILYDPIDNKSTLVLIIIKHQQAIT